MAHIKGPWSKRRKLNYAIEIYGPDDQSICTVYPNGRRDVHAIATLIAAAPEMLAELERIVEMNTGELGYEYETADWATTRAVIDKAHGE